MSKSVVVSSAQIQKHGGRLDANYYVNLAEEGKLNTVTIDKALEYLQKIKDQSKLGGDTCLCISLTDSEIETIDVHELALVEDSDGALVEVRGYHPGLAGE